MKVQPTFRNVHRQFHLNGINMSSNDLKIASYMFIKEGDEYERQAGKFLMDWFDQSETIILQTSGTTGVPKELEFNKQSLVESALATGDFFDLAPGMSALHCLPSGFIAGKLMWVRAFILGLHLDFVAPSSRILEKSKRYDFAALVPLQVEHSLENLHKVRKIIIGGAPLSEELAQQLNELPTEFYETYGMTETLTHVAVRELGSSYFKGLPGVTFSCDDRQCLVIDVPHISEEQIATNDVVEMQANNTFQWLGRIDGIINSGGVKIIPEQVEKRLYDKINQPFFIGGLPDDSLGTRVVLFVEGDPIEWQTAWEKDLGKYQAPKQVVALPQFARTESGKLQRAKTIETYLAKVN